jgi:hypothetical protein
VEVTDSNDPLLTTMEYGLVEEGDWGVKGLPESDVMWMLVSVSMYHSTMEGGMRDMVWNPLTSACWSQIFPGGEGMS